jgi:hypothetical protein
MFFDRQLQLATPVPVICQSQQVPFSSALLLVCTVGHALLLLPTIRILSRI